MKKTISILFNLFILIIPLSANNVLRNISNIDGLSNNSINCIFEDSDNVIWIGTWDGLNSFDGRNILTFRYNRNNEHSISNNVIRQILEQDKNHLWIATDHGINRWDKYRQEFTPYFHGPDSKSPKQENSYLIGILSNKTICSYIKDEGWFYYDSNANKFQPLLIKTKAEVKHFIIDNEDNIYILLNNGELYTSKVEIENGKPLVSNLKKLNINSSTPIEKIFFSENKLLVYSKGSIVIVNKLHNTIGKIELNKNNNASCILLHKNNVYASFYEGGCIKYSMTTNTKEEIGEISNKISIFTLFLGSQDILWAGTDGQGLMMIYEYTPLFRTIKSDYPIRSFCETDKGEILVGTKGGGIKKLNKTNNTLVQYLNIEDGLQSNSVYTLKKNGSGDIFIGTEGKGINVKYEHHSDVQYLTEPNGSPVFKSVYCIHFTNNDSVIWLGTSGYGLIKMTLNKERGKYKIDKIEQFMSSSDSHPIHNDIIYAIANGESENELWFGTRGAGLYKIDINTNKIASINHNILTNNDILCIQNTQSGLWVGTSYGLNKLSVENDILQNKEYTDNQGIVNNTIHGILEDESSNIWISTNLGLSFFNLKDNSVDNYSVSDGLQSNEFSDGAYFLDQNKYLYFGGVDGLNYFKPENIKRRNFTPNLRVTGFKIYNTQQNIQQRIVDNTLNLSYDEQYLSFTFVTNDFINNENCEFYYRLQDSLEEEWIYNGNNPNIIFSKLDPGNYTLEIKYTNGDKVSNNNIYKLRIHVARPWWFSNIAIIIYLCLLGVIIFFVQAIIKNRIRLNRQLLLEKIEKQHQQKVHEAKLDFFTNVAHEFFTPLTLIYGPAQHLLDTSNLDSYNKRYIHIIKNNAERMQKLISELMDFRKAKSGHKSIYAENINIKTLMAYISDDYMEISEQNEIDYKVTVSDDFIISSDRDFLEKILLNLISNAFKYTPIKGYIWMNVWQDKNNGALKIVIKNSGNGLTAQQMEEIFNKYKIFDGPQLKKAISTGIGLNLAKSLVELLGGTINVSSVYGEYVEFEVEIPPLKQNIHEKNIESGQDTTEQESNMPLLSIASEKNITILIVDDEKNIRELLRDILSPYYQILEASDGKQALEMVEHNYPDIIITDIMMPNLDGISLINNLKSNIKTQHIPIISISAKTSIEDSIEAYNHGADLYIVKPFHPRHILATVENLIRKQEGLKDYYQSGLSSITLKDGIKLHKDDEKFIHNIASYVHENINDENLTPTTIADFVGISKPTLYRNFKEILDTTPSEFIRTMRLDYAAKLLLSTKYTVMEIMYKSGFNNRSYFYREFAKKYKVSPTEYRNKYASI